VPGAGGALSWGRCVKGVVCVKCTCRGWFPEQGSWQGLWVGHAVAVSRCGWPPAQPTRLYPRHQGCLTH
jgi:hypothetical protein